MSCGPPEETWDTSGVFEMRPEDRSEGKWPPGRTAEVLLGWEVERCLEAGHDGSLDMTDGNLQVAPEWGHTPHLLHFVFGVFCDTFYGTSSTEPHSR